MVFSIYEITTKSVIFFDKNPHVGGANVIEGCSFLTDTVTMKNPFRPIASGNFGDSLQLIYCLHIFIRLKRKKHKRLLWN